LAGGAVVPVGPPVPWAFGVSEADSAERVPAYPAVPATTASTAKNVIKPGPNRRPVGDWSYTLPE
jgi:hypothetical protein